MGLLAFFCMATLLRPGVVLAVSGCTTPTDCDGDGTNNYEDSCPGSAATIPGQDPLRLVRGFRKTTCYLNFVPATPACIPVAVRPFDDLVPDDSLRPSGSKTRRVGFTYVGVYDVTSGGPAASATQATLSDIQADWWTAGGSFPNNALFDCMGSVEFGPTGAVKAVSPVVYGFFIVQSYVRALEDAAVEAPTLGLANGFQDALGLIDQVRVPGLALLARPGIIGAVGAWYDFGDLGHWGTNPSIVTAPLTGDLAPVVVSVFDSPCVLSKLHPVLPPTPFGRAAVSLISPVPQKPVYTPRFRPGEFLQSGNLVLWSPGPCSTPLSAPKRVFTGALRAALTSPLVLGPRATATGASRWNELIQGVAQPQTFPRAVDDFFGGVQVQAEPTAMYQLRHPRPLSAPPYHTIVGSQLLSSNTRILLVSPTYLNADWSSLQGPAVSALEATNLFPALFRSVSENDSDGTRRIALYLAAVERSRLTSQTFDFTTGKWTSKLVNYQGEVDGLEADVPLQANMKAPFPFASNQTNVTLALHLRADQWNPHDGRWLTNAASSVCPTLAAQFPGRVGSNSRFPLASEWCLSQQKAMAAPVQDYQARVAMCGWDNYDPGDANKHWPVVGQRVPFAGLFGQIRKSDATHARFANDLVHAGVTRSDRLHEGMDVNWEWNEAFADPASRDVFGQYAPQYCYGTIAAVEDAQLAMSCDDEMFKLCGSLADTGCNPAEAYWERWKAAQEGACACHPVHCGPLSWLCTGVACFAKEITECVAGTIWNSFRLGYDDITSYLGAACGLFEGTPCGEGSYVLRRRPTPTGERTMEHELEYNLAFGAKDLGIGYHDDCDTKVGPNSCEFSDYVQGNAVYTAGTQWPFIREMQVGLSEDMQASGPASGSQDDLRNQVWPFTLAPGLFQSPEGVWGLVTTQTGVVNSAALSSIPKIPILGVGTRAFRPTTDTLDVGFRLEELGDLIVDCGHNPLKPEIHPPVAQLLHLAGRYSLFGWHREPHASVGDSDKPIIADLWPDLPRPSATALPTATVVFDGGVVLGPDQLNNKWNCAPFPSLFPNRIRCILSSSGHSALDPDHCGENERMRPACMTDEAGGIVQVTWQEPVVVVK